MEGYDSYGAEFFDVKESPEVLNWNTIGTEQHDDKKDYNLQMLKERYGYSVQSYEVREIPRSYKRNTRDNAKLLIIKTVDGLHLGKRYNNNQKFKIEIY